MTYSAQDYSHKIVEIDALGMATIRLTSYDSLDVDWNLQLHPNDSDGSIVNFVESVVEQSIDIWDAARAIPTLTTDTVISDRYRPIVSDNVPDYWPLTQKLEEYDSTFIMLVSRHYSVVPLTLQEKIEYREQLGAPRSLFMANLLNVGKLDSAEHYFQVSNGMLKSAAWDGSTAGSFDWDTDGISSRGVKDVVRQSEGHFRVFFETPVRDAAYTAVTGIGDQKYSGYNSSPRQLTVIARDSAYVDVHCERTDDAGDEDNGFYSVHVHPSSGSLTPELLSLAVRFEEAEEFEFLDSVCSTLRTRLKITDSDFAEFMI